MRMIFLILAVSAASLPAAPIIREPGSVYLSDFHEKMPRFRLVAPAPCFSDYRLRNYIGTLRFPQLVQLDAISAEGMLRVRGNARQGGVAAWIEPGYVEGLPPDYLQIAQRAEERRLQIEELIGKKEVAVGMTADEVTRSLGKPQKRTSRTSREGSEQVFEYIKYKLIPQTVFTPSYAETIAGYRPEPGEKLETVIVRGGYGYQTSTVYVKVPVGSVKVGFVNGLVETIEESEGTLAGAGATMVAPPVELFW